MKRIAIAGNPNSGKTCIFNHLTGSMQRVGNYPGVTVEFVKGESSFNEEKVEIIDLPGTYSLNAYSQEEVVARNYIVDEKPDVIINVLDASNLERNLYLTAQLIELEVPIVLVLNMIDVAEKKGHTISAERISQLLGVKVVKTIASKKQGITEIKQACIETIEEKIMPHSMVYSHELQNVLPPLQKAVCGNRELCGHFPPRWVAIKLLEDDDIVLENMRKNNDAAHIEDVLASAKMQLMMHSDEETSTAVVEARYGFCNGVVKQTVQMSEHTKRMLTDTIDRIVCNRFFGWVILGLVVYCLFLFVFKCADETAWIPLFNGEWTSPTGLFQLGFEHLATLVERYISIPWLQSMLKDGIIGGVGGVMGFVPLIFFMFLFISVLEDSGYIARVAFILDRVLRTFGLQGKSILAMIVSGGLGAGGCAVPGVMATRTMREEKDRLITILVAPFMNCGAKMPVYAMLIAAFFSSAKTPMMVLLWLLSWCFALGSAFFLRKVVIKGEQTPFVMELPVYHMPTFKGIMMDTWNRTYMYIKKAATIILAINIILWAMMYYPRYKSPNYERNLNAAAVQLEQSVKSNVYQPIMASGAIDATVEFIGNYDSEKPSEDKLRNDFAVELTDFKAGKAIKNTLAAEAYLKYEQTVRDIENDHQEKQLKNSFAGRIGSFLTPVSRLAGFQWRENIALIGGFAAKEVVLGTMGTAYSMGEISEDNSESLSQYLAQDKNWNRLRAFVLLIFVMSYAPCFVTIAAIKKETGKWRWAIFSTVYSTLLAFVVSVIVYQVGLLFTGG